MKACGGCGSWIPDDAGTCPSCGGDVRGTPPAPPAPREPEPPPPPEPDPESRARAEMVRARAAGRVRALGVILLFYGGMLLAMVARSAWSYADGTASNEVPKELVPLLGPGFMEAVEEARPLVDSPWVQFTAHGVPFLLAASVLWAGISLRRLEGRRAGIAVAVALLALSPCQSCCCVLGIPVGLYALYVLTAGETRLVTR